MYYGLVPPPLSFQSPCPTHVPCVSCAQPLHSIEAHLLRHLTWTQPLHITGTRSRSSILKVVELLVEHCQLACADLGSRLQSVRGSPPATD